MTLDILCGQSFPLGATIRDQGVNFCVYSEGATAIELLLFDDPDAPQPSQVIILDPNQIGLIATGRFLPCFQTYALRL